MTGSLGKRIKRARTDLRLSQQRLGVLCDVSREAVSQWESDGTAPKMQNLVALGRHLSVSVDWLLFGDQAQRDVYKEAPIGLCHFDTRLRYVHINDWLAKLNGLSVAQHLGRTVGEVLPDVAAGVASQLRHVIETGEPILGGTVAAETKAQPGKIRNFRHTFHPVLDGNCTVVGVNCFVEEITERNTAAN